MASETFNTYDLVTVAKKGEYRILPGITGKLKKPIVLLLNKDEAERVSHVVYIPRNQGKKGTGTWTVSLDNELLITTQVDIRK
ncbi:hypothetical protein QNH10_12485 [Sporosarcina thermotolerans]|uniref:hypothetical protein n=1 Tax=Sporosarcina thermotolerans TaxID=633404 RepID=UPI0024BBFB35|nr:hypothetical protein [Sporosarcina thermotolerans]WHT47098.1 hypothetical protein QNH10_12485 [Sporosarcina thermotolerans]